LLKLARSLPADRQASPALREERDQDDTRCVSYIIIKHLSEFMEFVDFKRYLIF